MKVKKQKESNKSCFSFISRMDIYGHSINLTYNNEDKFKSTVGGISTIITRCVIVGYLVSILLDVFNNAGTITKSSEFLNTITDNSSYVVNSSNFDFAVIINNYDFTIPRSDYDLYIIPGLATTNFEWVGPVF